MKTEELDYNLPPELIAQRPLPRRSDSRLLVLERSTGILTDSRFGSIGDFLNAGDCLVLNDTKVIPARFYARRSSGGKLEGLFLAEIKPNTWQVMLKGGQKLKSGERFFLKNRLKEDFCEATILQNNGHGLFLLQVDTEGSTEAVLEDIGFAPLPPYIKRGDDPDAAASDRQSYQTVYASKPGAVAAPTAGLHFTDSLIEQLKTKGILFAYLTLHVGVGTFKPVTAENLEDHKIHQESFSINQTNAMLINETRGKGGRIIAVGTTSTRVLETVGSDQSIRACSGETDLFIRPGYEFKITDAMITNFHLPRSTLLALVAAFAGLEKILAAYKHAIEQRYRFYSYGDAMLIV
jgi:S-adenosylmethionine:tRNA ribosyltransferase-isomerase